MGDSESKRGPKGRKTGPEPERLKIEEENAAAALDRLLGLEEQPEGEGDEDEESEPQDRERRG